MIPRGKIEQAKNSLCCTQPQFAVRESTIDRWAASLGITSWNRYVELMWSRKHFLNQLPSDIDLRDLRELPFRPKFKYNAWDFTSRGSNRRSRVSCAICAIGFTESFFIQPVGAFRMNLEAHHEQIGDERQAYCPYCGGLLNFRDQDRDEPEEPWRFLNSDRIRCSKEWRMIGDSDRRSLGVILNLITPSTPEHVTSTILHSFVDLFAPRYPMTEDERWQSFTESVRRILATSGRLLDDVRQALHNLGRSEDGGAYLGEFRKALMVEIDKVVCGRNG